MTAVAMTPEQLLASDPVRKDGRKTMFQPEGDRTIKFTWETGEGNLWKDADQYKANSERVMFQAVLTVTHNKDRKRMTATFWQHHGEAGSCCVFDGRNGYLISTEPCARFNIGKLGAYADRVLDQARSMSKDPTLLAYFKPERV